MRWKRVPQLLAPRPLASVSNMTFAEWWRGAGGHHGPAAIITASTCVPPQPTPCSLPPPRSALRQWRGYTNLSTSPSDAAAAAAPPRAARPCSTRLSAALRPRSRAPAREGVQRGSARPSGWPACGGARARDGEHAGQRSGEECGERAGFSTQCACCGTMPVVGVPHRVPVCLKLKRAVHLPPHHEHGRLLSARDDPAVIGGGRANT